MRTVTEFDPRVQRMWRQSAKLYRFLSEKLLSDGDWMGDAFELPLGEGRITSHYTFFMGAERAIGHERNTADGHVWAIAQGIGWLSIEHGQPTTPSLHVVDADHIMPRSIIPWARPSFARAAQAAHLAEPVGIRAYSALPQWTQQPSEQPDPFMVRIIPERVVGVYYASTQALLQQTQDQSLPTSPSSSEE